jgi:hypothetical protein
LAARALIWLATSWWAVADASRVVAVCRAPLLATLVGGGLIALTDQARDMVLASAAPDAALIDRVLLVFFVLLWATTAWYWARATLYLDFALEGIDANVVVWRKLTARERAFRLRWRGFATRRVPRLIGVLGIASLAVAFDNAAAVYEAAGVAERARAYGIWAWSYAALAIGFYLAVTLRRPITLFLFGSSEGRSHLVPGPAHFTRLRDYLGNPLAATFLASSLALTPLLVWRFIADPVGTSALLGGAVNSVLLGLATMVPVFSLLVLLSKRFNLPLFAATVLWLAGAPWLFADMHDVRTLPASPPERATLQEAFDRWWAVNAQPDMTRPLTVAEGAGGVPVMAPPFIMVATSGGASRAAFWTSQVLGEIAAREPGFADRVFMISGVSGGSLGATVFRSIVEMDRRAASGNDAPAIMNDPAGRARGFVERDFLGPAMSVGLYIDLPFRTLSFLPRDTLPPDRAAALEIAWEAAWQASMGDKAGFAWSDGFAATFGDVGRNTAYRPWPILALNGTSVEKGKRVVTSNVRFGDGAGLSGGVNRYDAFDLLDRDIRISTAVSMSARFPVISPAGGMRGTDGHMLMRIIDGGLFENFGAATADEVLRHFVERRREAQLGQRVVIPIAILISSDPALDHLDSQTSTGWRQKPVGNLPPVPDCRPVSTPAPLQTPAPVRHPGNGWPECPVDARPNASVVADPILALYDGRVARGEQAATAMLDRIWENRAIVRSQIIRGLSRVARTAHARDDATGDPMDALDSIDTTVNRRLGTWDHLDFFHFRQCRVPGRKGPTMSWHDSQEAWQVMRLMTGLEAEGGDPCGNGAEFFRLCVRLARLTGEAEDDKAATALCEGERKWKRPAAWKCTEVFAGTPRQRWRCGLAAP